MQLSVIIITKNEAHTIAACLRAVHFADEIIVLDCGSNDDTVALAKRFTKHVFVTDWPGFGIQKNRALAKAQGDWVLSLDADEIVTPSLANEINQACQQSRFAAFTIPFRSKFLGKTIRFGDWQGESHLRLFRRDKAKFDDAPIHENLNVNGGIGKLKNFLQHEPYANQQELMTKMQAYAKASAEMKFQQDKKVYKGSAVLHGGFAFIRSYFLRAGFLDGIAGFKLAKAIAYYAYLKYRYLWQLNKA